MVYMARFLLVSLALIGLARRKAKELMSPIDCGWAAKSAEWAAKSAGERRNVTICSTSDCGEA
jgi:hypothetical protein